MNTGYAASSSQQANPTDPAQSSYSQAKDTPQQSSKHYPPRTCRICLETVNPTLKEAVASLPQFMQPTPEVTYESEDPESGRLFRPCKCKGSSAYVHEGCLQSWRHADVSYSSNRNYWQCPTCHYRYRVQKISWARWVSSTFTQLLLTFTILFLTVFILGFIADPIINLYLDPLDTIESYTFSSSEETFDRTPIDLEFDESGWLEHFLKGMASLGLLGFVKVILAMSPLHWLNIRGTGLASGGRRAGTTGRDRLASVSWMVVIVGLVTFIWVRQTIKEL